MGKLRWSCFEEKMNIEFKVVEHKVRHCPVVEIWCDGKFRAAIYPNDIAAGVRLVSTHLAMQPIKISEKTYQFLFEMED